MHPGTFYFADEQLDVGAPVNGYRSVTVSRRLWGVASGGRAVALPATTFHLACKDQDGTFVAFTRRPSGPIERTHLLSAHERQGALDGIADLHIAPDGDNQSARVEELVVHAFDDVAGVLVATPALRLLAREMASKRLGVIVIPFVIPGARDAFEVLLRRALA